MAAMQHTSAVASVEVANRLRDQSLAGDLVAGDRLPTEAELCERFEVSRSTMREALRMLASRGLVTIKRGVGGGTSVAHIRHEDATRMLRESMLLLAHAEGA